MIAQSSQVPERPHRAAAPQSVPVWRGWSRLQLTTGAVFLGTAIFLFALTARRFYLGDDEGILVDAARRVLAGQVPYKDFFILMGPGSIWLQAAALKLFGMSLAASRLVTVINISLLAGCICWLVGYRVNIRYGAWVAAIFVLLTTANPIATLPSHRWDSATAAMLALTIVASAAQSPFVLLAGAFAAIAAWEAPSMALLGVALSALLWARNRARFWPFVGGFLSISLMCVGVLFTQGGLTPMYQQLQLALPTYSLEQVANIGQLWNSTAQSGNAVDKISVAFQIILPLAVAAGLWKFRKTLSIQLLSLGAATMLISAIPRMDFAHLVYASPPLYALCAIFGARLLPEARISAFQLSAHAPRVALAGISFLAAVCGIHSFVDFARQNSIATAVGRLQASRQDADLLQQLAKEIPRGSKAFVFPYLPIAYFLTMTQNPTRFSYLQPGLTSVAQESVALEELQHNPPSKVLYFDLPEWQTVRIWPGSDPMRLRLSQIEGYLAASYQTVSTIQYGAGTLKVLEPKSSAVGDPKAVASAGRLD